MESYVWWSVAGIGLIIVEMVTGTFLLLVLGLAAFGGAAMGWFGFSFWIQVLTAVALAAVGMILVSKYRGKGTESQDGIDTQSLDIGHTVLLDSWVSEVDGVAKVRYRNATWDARVEGERVPGGTVFYIQRMDGNTLYVASKKSA